MSLECSNRAAVQKKVLGGGGAFDKKKNLLGYRKRGVIKKNKQFCLLDTPFKLNWTTKKRYMQLNQAAKNMHSSNNHCLLNSRFLLIETVYMVH